MRAPGIALAAALWIAGSAAAQEREDRPFVRGGIDDKPFLAGEGERLAIGGYADAQFRFQRVEGFADDVGFLLERFNLFTVASVSERVRVAAELEFEEGGEEVKIELAVLDFEIHTALNLRGGIVLSPLGRFNLAHDSPANDLVDRPLVSTEIIPTTLSEPGMGAFGQLFPSAESRVTYEVYAVNGFHEGVISASGSGARIPEGKGNWEDENARPAVVARVAGSTSPEVEVGLSVHYGPYNVYQAEGLDFEPRRDVRILAADWEAQRGRFRLSGEYASARVDTPTTLGFPERQQGFYAELGVRVLEGWIQALPASRFGVSGRFDHVDFDADGPGDDRRRVTVGLSFRPHPDTVFKLDWQRGWDRDPFETEENSAALLVGMASYF